MFAQWMQITHICRSLNSSGAPDIVLQSFCMTMYFNLAVIHVLLTCYDLDTCQFHNSLFTWLTFSFSIPELFNLSVLTSFLAHNDGESMFDIFDYMLLCYTHVHNVSMCRQCTDILSATYLILKYSKRRHLSTP